MHVRVDSGHAQKNIPAQARINCHPTESRAKKKKKSDCSKLLVLGWFVMQQQITDILSNAKIPWKLVILIMTNFKDICFLALILCFIPYYLKSHFLSSIFQYLISSPLIFTLIWKWLAYSHFLPLFLSTWNSMEYSSLTSLFKLPYH